MGRFKHQNVMKKIKTFILKITSYGVFQQIKTYLMSKYTVYTATLNSKFAYFKIGYSI
jgi:hypothetical protein